VRLPDGIHGHCRGRSAAAGPLCVGVRRGFLFSSSYDSGFTLFILFGLLVGFGGVMMIRAALRGQRR